MADRACEDCGRPEREHVSVFTREAGSCTVCPRHLPRSPSFFADVRAFQTKLGLVARDHPALLPGNQEAARFLAEALGSVRVIAREMAVRCGVEDDYARRFRLITEELHELAEAHHAGDLPEFADALADLVWVVLGTAVEAGVPFDDVWAEVRKANMAKLGGTLDASGKLQKPPGWTPPNVAGVLARHTPTEVSNAR